MPLNLPLKVRGSVVLHAAPTSLPEHRVTLKEKPGPSEQRLVIACEWTPPPHSWVSEGCVHQGTAVRVPPTHTAGWLHHMCLNDWLLVDTWLRPTQDP